MLQQILLMFHVIIAIALIALVLLQQGKGAEMGAAFGSGASQTVFGSQGSGSFLLKITGLLALLFFVTSLTLGYLAAHQTKQPDALQNLEKIAQKLPPQKPQQLPTQSNLPTQAIPNAGVPIPENTKPGPTNK